HRLPPRCSSQNSIRETLRHSRHSLFMSVISDARLQLHWAAQIPTGVGRTLIAQRPDDSNTAFAWSDERRALMQEPAGAIQAGIRLHDLTILANDDEFPLHRRMLDDGFAFLESRL